MNYTNFGGKVINYYGNIQECNSIGIHFRMQCIVQFVLAQSLLIGAEEYSAYIYVRILTKTGRDV